MPVDLASQEPILDQQNPLSSGEEGRRNRTKDSNGNAELIMDILIRGGDGVGPVGDANVISEACGLSVARVRQRIAELSITPSAPVIPVAPRPPYIADTTTNGDQSAVTGATVPIKKKINGTAPPVDFLDTLSPCQKEVVFAHFGHDGTAFDRVPRKSVKTIAAERGVKEPAIYALLQKALEKLWSEERPVQKKRGRKPLLGSLSKTSVPYRSNGKIRQISYSSDVRPIHEGIPEDQTQTYGELLKWLRKPEQSALLDGFEDACRKCKHNGNYRGDDGLSGRILESFRPGFLGGQVLLLAQYLNHGIFLQNFIFDIRHPQPVGIKAEKPSDSDTAGIQKPEVPVTCTTPVQKRPERVLQTPQPLPFQRKVFVPRSTHSSHHPFVAKSISSRPIPSPVSAVPEVKKDAICPDFARPEEAIEWLQGQTQWSEFYREALEKNDDLGISAFLTRKCFLLLRVLLTIKKNCLYTTIRDILCAVVPLVQVEKEILPPPVDKKIPDQVATAASGEAAEPEGTLHLSSEHEAEINRIFSLHKAGKYREFWVAIQSISQTETMNELREVQTFIKGQHFIDAIAYIGGEKIDKNLYVKHQCNTRIAQLRYVKAQGKRLLEHHEANKMKVIKEIIGTIDLKIPAITKKDQEWMGFDELDAPKSNLLSVIQVLVKLDGEDPDSTKKILRKLKQILGIPVS